MFEVTYTHIHKLFILGRAERGNRINRQPFPKHNSLFNNHHTLSSGQRGMTDTKSDHNIILMSKNFKQAGKETDVCVRTCVAL